MNKTSGTRRNLKRERNRPGGVLGIVSLGLFVLCVPNCVFACGEGCTTDVCCVQSCGQQNCYLDPQFGTSCVCDEPEPEPELPFCEHGDYLKWNGTRWVCEHCPSKYPDSDGAYCHLASGCYLIDTQVCGGTCLIHADGTSYCQGSAAGKHLEYDADDNLVCYSNSLPCSDFNASGCTHQSGTAHWSAVWNTDNVIHNPWEYYIHDYMAWDVNECKCEQDGVYLSSYKCTGKHPVGLSGNTVTDLLGRGSYEQAVYSRRDKIKYRSGTNYYCTHCDAGMKPVIFERGNIPRQYSACSKNDEGSHLACACSNVESGFYSDGCDWQYPLNSANIPENCHLQCPENMTTLDSGADSINSCVPYGGTYCDQTGCFKLGTNADLCE